MSFDRRRVRQDDPIHALMPYLMDRRCDSTILVTLNIALDPIRAYLKRKRLENKALSHMALILAATLRTVREYPQLNRFIYNRKFYEHTDFGVSIMVLRKGADAGMSKVFFDFDDDVFTVHRKLEEYIVANRGDVTNSTDSWTRMLVSTPGLAGLVSGIVKFLDRKGLAPKAIIDASPFHASMVLSNLGSIHTPRIYHHLFEFGTSSIFLAIGVEQYVPTKTREGVEMLRCIPLSFTIDERICSGAYFAKGFERLRSYLKNPELLELPCLPDAGR